MTAVPAYPVAYPFGWVSCGCPARSLAGGGAAAGSFGSGHLALFGVFHARPPSAVFTSLPRSSPVTFSVSV